MTTETPVSATAPGTVDLLAATFKALSEETRLQIVVLLLERGELCVCDVVGALGLTQSKASRHLRYLYNTGLVEDRREGTWMHYTLTKDMRAPQRIVVEALIAAIPATERDALSWRLDKWLRDKAAGQSAACADGHCEAPALGAQTTA